MHQDTKTAAVVPARDEAENLHATLLALREISSVTRILVVDNGSADSTAKLALGLGAEVIHSSPECGKGGALLAGLSALLGSDHSSFLLADADLGSSAANLSALLEALSAENPATIAAFPKSVASGGGFGLVKGFARREIFRKTGFRALEPLSGQRALLPGALASLPGFASGFGAEVGMTLDLLSAGITPLEIPVDLSHRSTGRSLSGFAHRARQGLDIARAVRGERLKW